MKDKIRFIDKLLKAKKKSNCCSVEIIEVKEENASIEEKKKDSCCTKK